MLDVQVAFLLEETEAPLTAGARRRLADLREHWRPLADRLRAILDEDVTVSL
jgi:hypothetical protein